MSNRNYRVGFSVIVPGEDQRSRHFANGFEVTPDRIGDMAIQIREAAPKGGQLGDLMRAAADFLEKLGADGEVPRG